MQDKIDILMEYRKKKRILEKRDFTSLKFKVQWYSSFIEKVNLTLLRSSQVANDEPKTIIAWGTLAMRSQSQLALRMAPES